MAEKKYKTPAGNIYTESELRKKYPDQFDSLVSNNKLTLVSDEGDVTEEEEVVEEPAVEEPAVEEPVVEKAEAPIPDYGSYLGYTPPVITTDQLGDATKTSSDVFLQELEKRKKTIFKEEAELSERLGEIEKQKRAELLEEEEAQQKKSTEIRESEKFKSVLDGIDKSLIKQDEEVVVPQLKEDFIDYGFVFEETGIGDALTVTTNDGKSSIVIDLDPFTESGAEKETKRLKDFLSSNVSFERKEEKVIEGTSKAESFYKNRNLNYQAEKNSYDEYIKVRDEIDRIEGIKSLGFDLGTQADEAAYYTDLSDLKEKESALFDVVMRDEAKETREGYDQYISGLIKLSMDKANDVYISAENKQADLDVYSKETFGVGLDGLQTYKAKSQEEVDVINDIFNDYNKANAEKRLAQDKYDLAISYFDTQVDKQIEQEYSENLSGFLNEFDKGLQQGLAAEVILMSALGIGYDMDDQDSRMEAAKKIYTHLSKNPGASSKVLSQYNKAVGAKETADILFNDPFELMTTLAASSLSMMLPYGYKIVGSTTLLGAGIGTGAGAAFAGVGALPGFITGTAKGFQTGMSATSLAMEYTNEVLDAAREKYDIMNDPTGEEMAKALADPEVWATGKERGLERGIPIAVMDLISGQLAGKIFTAGKFSGVGARVGAQIVERAVFDPLAEAAGETLAQMVVGDNLEYKEILSESLGSVGNNTTNMAVNLGLEAALNKNKALGKNLMMADFVAKESASDETIANWANRREKAGKMSKEDNQKIQKNVATRREARQLLDVGEKKSRKNSKVLSRTMILLNTKEILSSDPVRKSTFSKLIKEISNELEVIATTKKLSDKPVDVSAFVKEAVIEQVTTKSKPKYEKPTMFTTTTPEKYGTVNRQDGKGEVVLTEEEYNAEMEKFAPVEEAVVEEVTVKKKDEVQTGKPLKIQYNKNPKKAPAMSSEFGQDVEASGDYVTQKVSDFTPEGFETGVVESENPLVIDITDDTQISYKNELSQKYDGKVGEELSEAIRQDGYDAIITKYDDGSTGEIVLLKGQRDAIQKPSTEAIEDVSEKTTAEAIPEPIKKATKEDRDAFDAGTMNEERTGGIISDIADRIISGRKLTPFLKRFQEKNKEKVEEMIAFKSEVSDLEASINETFEQVNNAVDGKPRMRKGEDEVAAEDYVDLVSVIKEMNELDPRLVNYTTPKLSEDIEVSPISEATDTSPIPQEILDFYGVKDATEFEKSIEDFEGIPMVRGGMTDMLGGGKVKDSMGNDMEIGGGIMFSLRNIANKGLAWAGIDKKGANTQYKDAVSLYNNNKALFERLWKEGRLPNGHIPMTITKMADSGVNSNEAVFRYVLPKIKSVPLENRKKSFEALTDKMFEMVKRDGAMVSFIGKKHKPKVEALIEKYKVTTMDEFLEAIIKDANLRTKNETQAILSLDNRAAIFNVIFSNADKSGNTQQHSTALFEGMENDPFLLNTQDVYDAIAEKSVKDTPKGYVVAVVGIDVLNGGVTEASHTNYGFGPKGRLIGLITNPRHQADIFPEQTARAAGQAKLKKSEKTGEVTMTSDKTILGQALSNYFNMLPAQGQKVRIKPDTTQQLIGLMRLTFPSVQAYTSQAEFDNVLKEEGVREHLVDGVPILGLTKDGKIYINPSQPSINTPIHEFGHIWTDMLRSSEKGRELLAKGLSMVDSDPKAYEAAKRKYAEYDADGNITNEELVREEALVSMIAAKGEGIVDAAQKSNFKNWLKGVMEYVKKNFKGTFEAVGTGTKKKIKSIIDDKMVEELSLDGFLNMAIADLLSGEIAAVQPKKSPTPQESRAKMSKKQAAEGIKSNGKRSNLDDVGRVYPLGIGKSMLMGIKDDQYKPINDYEQYFDDKGIFERVKKMGVRVVELTDEMRKSNILLDVEGKMLYDNVIAVDPKWLGKSWNGTNVIQHEAAHTYTVGVLLELDNTKLTPTEIEYKNDINSIFNSNKTFLNSEYGFNNSHEMVAEFLSNSKFRDYIEGNNLNLFQKIKKAVSSFLNKATDLKLSDVLSKYNNYVDSSFNQETQNIKTESLESSSVRFSKGSDVSMSSIINEGRRLGFSEKAIKEILRRRKFKVSDINKALEVSIDLLTPLPPEFGDIEGGVEAGEKLYRSVRKKLGSFVKRGIKDSEGKRRDVSFSETQRKAIELLKQDAVFKNQPEVTQKALIVAMDASLNVDNSNPVSSEIGAIKASLSKLDTKKQGKREVKELQTRLKNFIRKSLIKSDNYSQADINKLIRTVVDIDSITFNEKAIADFQISAQKALEVVEKQRDRKKNKTISKIISRVKKGAQKKRGSGSAAGKVKAGVTEQEGQLFFAQAQKILEAVKNGTVDNIRQKLNEPEVLEIIEGAIVKENNKESLTQKEKTLLNRAYALDTFGNIMNMEIEALETMLESVNDVRKFSALQLRSRRQARTLENAELNAEGTSQIEKGFPSLFKTIENKDGTTKKVLKDENERNSDRKAITNEFKKGKVFSSIAKLTKRLMEFRTNPIDFALKGSIYHLGTLTNILDRGGNFFTKNIYDALNNANEVKLQGFDNQMDFLNSIAETFDGIKGTPLNPAYRQFKNKLNKKELNIGKIRDKDGFLEENETMLTTQQAMRLYALSKNPVQRAKLEAMGIGKETMSQIIAHIGKDAVTLVDATVDYLSNDYFESINSVYSQTNDVNLNYVENYFPTRSVMDGTTEVSEKGLDFSKQFTAENESALNKRVDMSSPILVSQSFDVALDAYFDSMENYKAHAVTVKKINAIFKNKAVAALLKETGLKDLMRSQINYAINGTTPYQVAEKAGFVWNSFVGVALGLKAIQILKQASSFVQAFEDYSFRGQGKKKIPGLDLMMFMLDGAYTYATFPLQIKKAWGVSATFRDRLRRGLDGDVYGLESGRNQYRLVSQNNQKLKSIKRGWRALTVAATVIGDVLGVLGYMINYNRNIRNGMPKAEAVEKLNNYNATQQTRRNTEVSQISQNNNVLIRVFTTFGSTIFLQINNVSQAFTNIMRGMKKGEKVKAKDIRKLALNMSIANGLFVGASNIAKIIKGDEDDREEVMNEMVKALTGLNLLFNIPLIGEAAELGYNTVTGQRTYSGGLNPYKDFVNKFIKALNSEEVTLEASKVITSIMIKANVDPIVAVYNGFVTDEGFDAKTVMELIGISPSYRPAESSGSAAPLERTLDDMLQDGDFDDIDTNVDIDTDFETNVDF
jgi:hypothetical protein